MTASQLSLRCREEIIRSTIERAKPRWWSPFGWFDICPVSAAAQIFHLEYPYNDAFDILQAYHCVHYFKIPPEIRRAIPALIREALSGKVRVTCEIEPAEMDDVTVKPIRPIKLYGPRRLPK